MHFADDYLKQAEECIKATFLDKRQTLLEANGNISAEMKEDQSLVTALDKEMELELKARLKKIDAGVGFHGEEFGAEGSSKTFWAIDPIDGTESFVRGLPFFRNMATLIDGGQTIYTIVYRVVADEFFIAHRDKGAFKNGERLRVSQRPLHRSRLEVWAKFSAPGVSPLLAAIEPHIENIRFNDEFLFVAEAKLDVHLALKPQTKIWDHAARTLLLAETGAKVANIGSDTYDYTNGEWLAANPEVFAELMPLIAANYKS